MNEGHHEGAVPRELHDVLRAQLAEANARIAELTAQVGRLAQAVAAGNERVAELLAIANRKKRGTRRKPAKAPLPPPELDDAAKDAFNDRPVAPPLPEKKKHNKPRKPTGRKAVPEHLKAEEHYLRPDTCDSCGGANLDDADVVREEKLHTVKEHQRRRVVERTTCRCRDCGHRTTPRSLPSPFPRSKATPEWLAWLVHQKFGMLAPLDRVRRDLASRGVKLAISYLVTQIERAADILAPVDGEHWKQLLAGNWMATDATGLKVLIPKLPGTHNGYLEAYRRNDLVVFQYEAHKGSDVLASKLRPFSGVLVADAEHRHNAVFEDGSVLEAGCNAHGRRKLRDAEIAQPVLAAEGGAFVAAMYVAEADAHKKGLIGRQLKAWRQTKVAPIRTKMLEWMDAVEPTLIPDDALAKVIRYYRNHWEALGRFIDHPEIPIDNSATEREYQNVAKLRNNSLFAGSSEGAHRWATLMGLSATCRAIDVDFRAYLAWAFTRLGTHRDVFAMSIDELTPSAYKRTRAAPA